VKQDSHIKRMSESTHPVYRILEQLEAAKIYYELRRIREDTIMIDAHVPGRRYEIEVFGDGSVEVEIFKSDGRIEGQEWIDELLRDYSEPHDTVA
jgi:hypothetical protein